jgi:hypothetical protein
MHDLGEAHAEEEQAGDDAQNASDLCGIGIQKTHVTPSG